METLIQDLFARGGLRLATDDIAAERQRLRALGISLSEDIQGT